MNQGVDITVNGGQEFAEFDGQAFGLGLQMPAQRTIAYPTLSTMTPLLPIDEIKQLIASEDFKFGQTYFDDSWLTNQNGYGSCASYAGSSALAKARVLGGQDRVDLSGDYLYSLVNGGRDRGSMLDDNMRAIMNKGVAAKSTVPLGGIYRNNYDTQKADTEARRFRGHELYACPDEQSVATALAMRIPVVIAIHVGRNWRREDSRDVLIGDSGPGNHSEHLDDIRWSEQHGRFEFREGSSHKRPYFWVYWSKHLAQPSRYHMFYAVPSAIEDPHGDNPSLGSREDQQRIAATPKLIVTSQQGCVWCDRWKENVLPKVRRAGYEIVEGQTDGSGVPRFKLLVGDRSVNHTGYWSFDDIESAVGNLR